MKPLNKFNILTIFSLVILTTLGVFSQSFDLESQTELLIDRLDANVKSKLSDPQDLNKSAKELLDYYKKRTSVKHPINQKGEEAKITEKDLKYANDALEHIFVGQPAYPSHFCGEDIDWNSRPVPDLEWVWQLNRMYFWNSMGKIYAETKDERYAKAWCEQIVDWTIKNPRDKEHAHAWRSIEAGIRGHNWTGLFHQFIGSEHFTPEVLVALMNSSYEHAEFLMTKYTSGSNWSLMEAEGLAFIAFTFPEFENSKKWRTESIRRFSIEIDKQVYPDGHQRELAMGYHIGCIHWFYRTYELAKLNGIEDAFPSTFKNTIEKMCEIPMKLDLPDGTSAQFGDSWAGQPGQHAKLFADWAKLFNREDFRFMATNGQEGKMPAQTAYALEQSGIYSLRSGWDNNATCMVLKCGPDGGGHSQPDNGTFTLQAGGRTLMPDGGSFIYHGDPEGRSWFRQTKVHQTLTLNGENTKYAPKLLKWQPGDDLDILVVENAGNDNLTHRRSVFFVDKKYFVIVDEAIGTGTGDVDIHFQLAPGKAVFNENDLSVRSDFQDGWNILVRSNEQKGITLSEEEGQVSFIYTKKEPRPAFRYRLKKTNASENVQFVTLVAPYENEIPDIKVKLQNEKAIGSNSLKLVITENGKKIVVACQL
ncbi:heparan-sulfate lyase [Spirosomataceae bacterium TFI 002]|nr:heparan-sulfate lyase [Spirosomataceae bacterium TFI 002]